VIYELLTHRPPFDAPELAYKVLQAEPAPLPTKYHGNFRQIVLEKMLQKDPGRRLCASQLLADPYVIQAVANWMHVCAKPHHATTKIAAHISLAEWKRSSLALLSWY
jgi:serine/threonine protein kinase